MRIVDGTIEETQYDFPDGKSEESSKLRIKQVNQLESGSVAFINGKLYFEKKLKNSTIYNFIKHEQINI